MVNIYETPVKPSVNLEDGVTVYVPGYSYIGPEEPTLCSTESEFESLFGSSPYLFEADQPVSKISEGSPEKGYLYAKSLLASGLKVLFHRYKVPGIQTAEASFNLKTAKVKSGTYTLVAKAVSFGKSYVGVKVTLKPNQGNLFDLTILNNSGVKVYSDVVSMDPSSSLYIKLVSLPLIKFMAKDSSGNIVDIEDSLMMSIVSGEYSLDPLEKGELNLILSFIDATGAPDYEFYLDDVVDGKTVKTKGMLSSLADSSPAGMMYPLGDFERYPSVTYLTTGGYYTNISVAGNQLAVADKIKAFALVDLNLQVNDISSWRTAQEKLKTIPGSTSAKGKGALFLGCNSFDLSPYRIVLGDSFNYLKCLGENIKKNIADWIPVANDPNGVSPCGYDTTQKIDTELSELIAEANIGIQANPLIYSHSAGGYKIMGNRTLLSNDGVLSPNSFINISIIVNKVSRAARQIANKLKIVSTDPKDTFNKFRISVSKTIDPMVTTQDGILSYKIKHLKKSGPATIDIQIALVVVEGIEKFNIYIPYSISLD